MDGRGRAGGRMKVTFVTGVVVVAAAAPLSEFTTALVVQFCVGSGGQGGAAVVTLQGNRPTDRLHERTSERSSERTKAPTDGRQPAVLTNNENTP